MLGLYLLFSGGGNWTSMWAEVMPTRARRTVAAANILRDLGCVRQENVRT